MCMGTFAFQHFTAFLCIIHLAGQQSATRLLQSIRCQLEQDLAGKTLQQLQGSKRQLTGPTLMADQRTVSQVIKARVVLTCTSYRRVGLGISTSISSLAMYVSRG